jgi:hypothetical protein
MICPTPTLHILYPIILLFYHSIIIYLSSIKCSDGLGIRVEDCQVRGQWFESSLEQFVLKTEGENSGLGNRNMIRKIPTWWENSVLVNRKTAGKNSGMVGNFPQWEKKVFRCMDHLVLRHPSYRLGFAYPFSISVYLGLIISKLS